LMKNLRIGVIFIRCGLTIEWTMVMCSLNMLLGVWKIGDASWKIMTVKLIKGGKIIMAYFIFYNFCQLMNMLELVVHDV
jgi:hypothetical protein